MHGLPSTFVRALVPIMAALLLAAPAVPGGLPPHETRDALKLRHLQQINSERERHGLAPVRLDSFSSLLADSYCEQQIRERTTGHFLTDGQAPYMRYSFAGGNDGLSQNVAAWSANYLFTDTMLPDLLHQSLGAMLAEKPPADGHRRAILDPHATHVGIGMAWAGGEFRLSQEFLRRYIDWKPMPQREARTNQRVMIAGKTRSGTTVQAVSVHYEREPQPISATVANRIETYALPSDRIDYVPKRFVNGAFSFTVPFTRGPGVYTVVVWVRPEGGKDVVEASNISIRARAPQLASATGDGSR